MEPRDLEILSGFDAVWARVCSDTEAKQVLRSPQHPLEAVLDGLFDAWSGYRQLACCSCGGVRQRLTELAEEAKCTFRNLQLVYFLDTGELYHPAEDEKFASCTLSNLRKLWQNASKTAQMLQALPQGDGIICADKLRDAEAIMICQKQRLGRLMAEMMK